MKTVVQLRLDGGQVVSLPRAEHEHHAALDALRALMACPDAHASAGWRALLQQARAVLAKPEPPSPRDDRDPPDEEGAPAR